MPQPFVYKPSSNKVAQRCIKCHTHNVLSLGWWSSLKLAESLPFSIISICRHFGEWAEWIWRMSIVPLDIMCVHAHQRFGDFFVWQQWQHPQKPQQHNKLNCELVFWKWFYFTDNVEFYASIVLQRTWEIAYSKPNKNIEQRQRKRERETEKDETRLEPNRVLLL